MTEGTSPPQPWFTSEEAEAGWIPPAGLTPVMGGVAIISLAKFTWLR